MSLDLSTLSPAARASYILIGRQFGSMETLAQANQTLQGLSAHGAALIAYGFSADDAQRLQDARDALIDAGVGRDEVRGGKKVNSATYIAAMKGGRASRRTARSVLTGVRRALHELGDPASEAGAKQVDAALAQTRLADDDAGTLARQLDVLRGAFGDPAVTAEAKGRGGPQAVADLLDQAAALRAAAAARAGAPGTPDATEHLDLLDGLVVMLARNARQAAHAAAKHLGKPALDADFELSKLYAHPAAPPKGAAPGKPAPSNGAGAPNATPA